MFSKQNFCRKEQVLAAQDLWEESVKDVNLQNERILFIFLFEAKIISYPSIIVDILFILSKRIAGKKFCFCKICK